ncbi:nuclear transport factor 2 family protein [Rugamonas sp.]|uniref:YybH family protein n=1 Tax=Rugamonas sp. TaxID=1926287 RepID=UPI0025DF5A25|nr:nuclear transport factor 2 family protein [Rugamonas sp.]
MRLPISLLVLSAVSAPLFAATPSETLAEFHEALAAGKSGQASELLSPEIQIYESGYVERSREEYTGHHLKSDVEFAKFTKNKVLKQSERIDGKLAVVMQETETTGKYKGSNVHLFGTETALLEKQGEKWVIVHIHWSSRKSK